MLARSSRAILVTGLLLALYAAPARAQDMQICLKTADRMTEGRDIDEAEKRLGHEACLRALSASSSIVQKYQLQEADFDIIGRPKP